MNLLWIVPKWPFPVADGARIATTQLLKNITHLGVRVHLCALISENENTDAEHARRELGVTEVSIIRRKGGRVSQFLDFLKRPWVPITLSSYAKAGIAQQIKSILASQSFDLVVYDGLHASAWRSYLPSAEFQVKQAYRAHNVESEIWFRAAQDSKSVVKKTILYLQGLLVRKIEQRLSQDCEFVFPVSFSDEKKFLDYTTVRDIHTVPIGMTVKWKEPSLEASSEKRDILFVGKLDWAPNRHGLEWVLKEVWPSVVEQTSDLKLVIVGSGDHQWIKPYLHLPGIEFAGQVESLAPYYENCIATLVPIFYGSGTRVKVIESILHGRACISTEIGVEGVGLVPGESYHRVESAQEWVHTLVNLKREDALKVGRIAREYAKSVFDPRLIAQRMLERISVTR